MLTSITTTLEDVRNGVFFETKAEFARRLGITEQTYRRVVERDPRIENPTKRQIATRLSLPPHLISDLVPPPSPTRIAALTAVIDEANATHGWALLGEDGTLTPAPQVSCPPGTDTNV